MGRRLVRVGDPEAAAHVDVAEPDPLPSEVAREGEHPVDRVEEGPHRRDLRSDVAGDSLHVEGRVLDRDRVEAPRVVHRDAELVVAKPGRDVRVRLRIDVGIHAQRDGSPAPQPARDDRDPRQLRGALDVEHPHARLERERDLLVGLADAGEHHLARIPAGAEHAVQLAARDDVEAGAEPREEAQHRQVRVGLHRIADDVAKPGERSVEDLPVPGQGRGGVDVERRTVAIGEALQRDRLGVQDAPLALEVVHGVLGAEEGGLGVVSHVSHDAGFGAAAGRSSGLAPGRSGGRGAALIPHPASSAAASRAALMAPSAAPFPSARSAAPPAAARVRPAARAARGSCGRRRCAGRPSRTPDGSCATPRP